ncbi:hypothetical protein [Alteribacter populi]|uniref:hypothetical protein n=1 Tax=Alteribacter populi TaxID=2011011 RepID=UPI000BBAD5AD|nr:hypothetical protein [Alteribacter populi]
MRQRILLIRNRSFRIHWHRFRYRWHFTKGYYYGAKRHTEKAASHKQLLLEWEESPAPDRSSTPKNNEVKQSRFQIFMTKVKLRLEAIKKKVNLHE